MNVQEGGGARLRGLGAPRLGEGIDAHHLGLQRQPAVRELPGVVVQHVQRPGRVPLRQAQPGGVEGCQLAFNSATAVNAAVSGADIRLSNNEIYNNTTGIAIAAGATVRTTSNNRVFGNGSSTAPNGGAVTQQ